MELYAKKREKFTLILILIIFAGIFSSISLINHYQFRTYALDLGMFNQAVFAISKFNTPIFSLGLDGKHTHFLATHFSLITYLYAPFVYVFGTYALLIIQIASILLGGLGIYKYSKKQFDADSLIPLILLIHFFSIWGIYSALSFDFHNNVIGAMLIIWLIYFIESRKLFYAAILFILAIATQESIALWVFFILIGLMLKNRKAGINYFLKFEIPVLAICFVYVFTVIFILMPWIQDANSNLQLARYSHLGNSATEIIIHLIKSPKYIFSLFFESNNPDPITFGIKSELHFMVLISGGFALCIRPYCLVMLIPIYAQKMLTNDFVFWGINLQYSIEFVPILSICLIDLVASIKLSKHAYVVAALVTCATILYTLKTIENRSSLWYNKKNSIFYSKEHFTTELNIAEINKALQLIPQEAAISVSSSLAPHLACHDKIYHFPIINDASYVVLLTKYTSTYPLNETEFTTKTNELKSNKNFIVIYNSEQLLIVRKK
jgi:uncharacterized membrane protein